MTAKAKAEKVEVEQEFLSAEELAKKADPTSVALLNKTKAGLSALAKTYSKAKIPDASTPEGYEQIKEANKVLTKTRTSLKTAKDTVKAPFLTITRKIDAEFKTVNQTLEDIQEPWKKAKQDEDERAERVKQERIARLQKKVDDILAFQVKARGVSSGEIAELLNEVELIDAENDFYDLTQEAIKAKAETVEFLDRAFDERLQWEQSEAERVKLEAEKAALEAEKRVSDALAVYGSMVGNFMDADRAQLEHQIIVLEDTVLPNYGNRQDEVEAAKAKAYAGLKKLLAMLPEEEVPAEPEQYGNPGEHIRAEEAASVAPVEEIPAVMPIRLRSRAQVEAEYARDPEVLDIALTLVMSESSMTRVMSLLMDQFEVEKENEYRYKIK